jgi:hypothetical protein
MFTENSSKTISKTYDLVGVKVRGAINQQLIVYFSMVNGMPIIAYGQTLPQEQQYMGRICDRI